MSSQSISIHGGRETPEVSLHYLPCKVECDCEGDTSKDASSERGRRPAEVDCFFEPVIREGSGTIRMGRESSQIFTATFRGRPLKGVEISVPEGYRGVVLREQGTVSHDSQGREFVMRNHFDKIKLWNLQTCPTADDKLVQALKWTQLAQTVSSKATRSFAPGLVEYMTFVVQALTWAQLAQTLHTPLPPDS